MKLALAQMRMTEDMGENLRRSIRAIRTAAERGAELVCFPEIQLTPFFPQYPGREVSGYVMREDSEEVRAVAAACREARIFAATNFYLDYDGRQEIRRTVVLLLIVLGLPLLLDHFGLLNRLVPRQLGESGMSYGLFFLTGLLTSVHCVAMCGGICLSQSLPGRGRWAPLWYNAGRMVSYTLLGVLLGFAGRLLGGGDLVASPVLQGAVKLVAGACMLIAGVNLLGLFPALRKLRLRLPKLRAGSRLPFVIGLLNGLMPCGPLQAMQLTALGSGDPSGIHRRHAGDHPLQLLDGHDPLNDHGGGIRERDAGRSGCRKRRP